MSKGTIVYVGNYELPDKGASANRVVSNGKIFQKLGYQVAYLGIRKEDRFEGIQVLDEERNMYEEAYPRGSKEWLMHMYSIENIQSLVKKYEDVCMIILYNVPFLLLHRTKKAFQNTGIKVVYDCTEWTGVTDGSFSKKAVKRLDEYFIRNHIVNAADGLIVISRMMEKQYQKCKNMVLIPPLVDIYDSMWHQKIEKNDDRYEFCFAGILDGNKESLDKIVEAFSNLDNKNSVLRIIGVTEKEFLTYYPGLEKILKRLDDRILFMGQLSHSETIKYVLQCDSYIFIRQSDRRNNAGFPTKFAEAYSSGSSIITTDISDIKEYLKDSNRGQMIDSTSAEEVEKAMRTEMHRNELRKEKELNHTFHYETYLEKCKLWLEKFEK